MTDVLNIPSARKVGETTPAGAACRASPLTAPGGGAPKQPARRERQREPGTKNRIRMCKAEKPENRAS